MKHWFAVLGAMLVVALRTPLRSLLGDTWFYSMIEVVPRQFELPGAFMATMTTLITIFFSLKWMDYRKTLNKEKTVKLKHE